MKKILIIEDSYLFRSQLRNILKDIEDIFISEADSALQVLHSLGRTLDHVDLIIIDIIMPDLDGLEFVQILRKTDIYSNIPVIFISGKSDPKTVQEALSLGAMDFLLKPIDFNDVSTRIKKALNSIGENRNFNHYNHNKLHIEEEISCEYERSIRSKSHLSFISFYFSTNRDAIEAIYYFKENLRRIDKVFLIDHVLNVMLPFTEEHNIGIIVEKLLGSLENSNIKCVKNIGFGLSLEKPESIKSVLNRIFDI